jgi:hypothetical protein
MKKQTIKKQNVGGPVACKMARVGAVALMACALTACSGMSGVERSLVEVCEHGSLEVPNLAVLASLGDPAEFIAAADLEYMNTHDADDVYGVFSDATSSKYVTLARLMSEHTECEVVSRVDTGQGSSMLTVRQVSPDLDTGADHAEALALAMASRDEDIERAFDALVERARGKTITRTHTVDVVTQGERDVFALGFTQRVREARRAAELAELDAQIATAKERVDEVSEVRQKLEGLSVVSATYARRRLEVTVVNELDVAVSKVEFEATVREPGRSTPILEEYEAQRIRGGIEPGEELTLTFKKSRWSKWASARPSEDAELTLEVVALYDADSEEIAMRPLEHYDFLSKRYVSFSKLDDELAALEKQRAELAAR